MLLIISVFASSIIPSTLVQTMCTSSPDKQNAADKSLSQPLFLVTMYTSSVHGNRINSQFVASGTHIFAGYNGQPYLNQPFLSA